MLLGESALITLHWLHMHGREKEGCYCTPKKTLKRSEHTSPSSLSLAHLLPSAVCVPVPMHPIGLFQYLRRSSKVFPSNQTGLWKRPLDPAGSVAIADCSAAFKLDWVLLKHLTGQIIPQNNIVRKSPEWNVSSWGGTSNARQLLIRVGHPAVRGWCECFGLIRTLTAACTLRSPSLEPCPCVYCSLLQRSQLWPVYGVGRRNGWEEDVSRGSQEGAER